MTAMFADISLSNNKLVSPVFYVNLGVVRNLEGVYILYLNCTHDLGFKFRIFTPGFHSV